MSMPGSDEAKAIMAAIRDGNRFVEAIEGISSAHRPAGADDATAAVSRCIAELTDAAQARTVAAIDAGQGGRPAGRMA